MVFIINKEYVIYIYSICVSCFHGLNCLTSLLLLAAAGFKRNYAVQFKIYY